MQIKKLLKIQSLIEERAVPSDMLDEGLTYWSETHKTSFKILDMHLIHFIRAFSKMQDKLFSLEAEKEAEESVRKQLSELCEHIETDKWQQFCKEIYKKIESTYSKIGRN